MMRPRWRALIAFTLLIASCDFLVTGPKEIELLKQEVITLQSEITRTQVAVHCKDPRVLDFLQQCKELLSGGSGQCNQLNVEQAVRFMIKEEHVLVRLWPDAGLTSMTQGRKNQLSRLVGKGGFRPISSVLVIAQPQSDKPEDSNEALAQARRLKRYLNETMKVPEHQLHGPLPVTCRGKSQLLDMYARAKPDDKPDREEPQARDPKIAVWVFRLDCGNYATASAMDRAERDPAAGLGPSVAAR